MSGLRVVIVDDAPYVTWEGRTHAANATFHRFAAALLDVHDADGERAIASVVLAAPVRPAASAPATLPVDARIRVLATEPFDGIAGYLRRAPLLVARNAPRLRRAVAGADVVLLRLPASNGLLAALVAAARGVPRVGYVVGSVREVVAGQARGGVAGLGARIAASGYDAATRLAALGAPVVVAGADLARGGVVSSLVEPDEIRSRHGDPWPAVAGSLRLVYAGRLAEGKGLDVLLDAVVNPGDSRRSAGGPPRPGRRRACPRRPRGARGSPGDRRSRRLRRPSRATERVPGRARGRGRVRVRLARRGLPEVGAGRDGGRACPSWPCPPAGWPSSATRMRRRPAPRSSRWRRAIRRALAAALADLAADPGRAQRPPRRGTGLRARSTRGPPRPPASQRSSAARRTAPPGAERGWRRARRSRTAAEHAGCVRR